MAGYLLFEVSNTHYIQNDQTGLNIEKRKGLWLRFLSKCFPHCWGKAIKVLKLLNLLLLDLLNDTGRFVWSKVLLLAALTAVEAKGNVGMFPLRSIFNAAQQTSRALSTALLAPSHY